MADKAPKFDDTMPLPEHPKFEDTSELNAGGLPETIQDTEAGLLRGSLLDRISAGLGAVPRALVTGESPTEAYRAISAPMEQSLTVAQQRSPIATTVGQVAGSIVPAIATTGATSALTGLEATGLAGKAALGASDVGILGGLSGASEGQGRFIGGTPEEAKQALEETGKGALAGAVLGGAGELIAPVVKAGASKIGDALKNSDFAQAAKLAMEGQPIAGQAGKSAYAASEKENILDLMTPFKETMSHIGDLKNKALEDATEAGTTINVNNVLESGLPELSDIIKKGALVVDKGDEKAVLNALTPFTQSGESLTPLEADALNKKLRELKFKLGREGSPLYSLIDGLQGTLKKQVSETVPGYSEANKLYTEFMNAGPDHILSQGMKDLNFKSYGSSSNPDAALYSKLEDLIYKSSSGSDLTATRVKDELLQNLKSFDAEHPGFLQESGFGSVDDYSNKLKNTIGETNLYQKYAKSPGIAGIEATKPIQAIKQLGKSTVGPGTGSMVGSAIKQGAGALQIAAGSANAYVKTGQKLLDQGFKTMYDASPEFLKGMADQLSIDKSTKYIGQSLNNAIQNKDNVAKNAAIFSILQNPAARRLLDLNQEK